MKASPLREKILHRAFQIGVAIKGIDGLIETIGGLVFLCLSGGKIREFVLSLTHTKLMHDPDDKIASSLQHTFSGFSPGTKWFVGAYLLGHGVIKLALVVGLLRRKLWIFPFAIVALLGFITFQIFHLFHKPSITVTVLACLDAIVVVLVWHEYRVERRKKVH